MYLLLILYLLLGVALAELMRKEQTIHSWEQYAIMIILHPVVIISALCLTLYTYWRNRRK
mgnify:CR=1 FL=1